MAEKPKSILVIKPSSFGDVIHTLPAVALLKQSWPEAKVSWLINPEWSPLLEANPDLSEVIPFPRQQFRGLGGGWRFLRWCREVLSKRSPDLTIDFQGLLRSAWMGWASDPKRLVGMSDAREGARWLYQQVVPMPKGVTHSVERYLATTEGAIRHFDPKGWREPGNEPFHPLPQGNPPETECPLPDHFILLHPFARGRGKSLSWEQVVSLCGPLASSAVLLVGRQPEGSPKKLPENCISLLNRTSLTELIWLIRRASVVITVDSGPSHLAAALKRPMVAIHTWSDPRRVGPFFADAKVWKNGMLLTMREIGQQPEPFFRQTPKHLENDDLVEIAEVAISLSSSSA